MGIDVYLEWEGMDEEKKQEQYSCGFSIMGGHTGYLRESYHGEPYATQILVREAFESDDCRAQIPAAVMRERLTNVTEPAYGKTGGHKAAQMFAQIMRAAVQDMPGIAVEGAEGMTSGQTSPMTVEEAVAIRARTLYNADDDEVAATLNSFRNFVELAERKERETGKPCTVYASY